MDEPLEVNAPLSFQMTAAKMQAILDRNPGAVVLFKDGDVLYNLELDHDDGPVVVLRVAVRRGE